MNIKVLKPIAFPPKIPSYGNCGYDLISPIEHCLMSHGQIEIPLGFAIEISYSHCGFIKDRSSMARKGIHVLGGVIDPSYRGELIVILKNLSPIPYLIQRQDKIAQLVIVSYSYDKINIVDELTETERGENGFGSTGR